jgi:hypothetical protein
VLEGGWVGGYVSLLAPWILAGCWGLGVGVWDHLSFSVFGSKSPAQRTV